MCCKNKPILYLHQGYFESYLIGFLDIHECHFQKILLLTGKLNSRIAFRFFNAPIDRGVNKIGSETINSLNDFSKNIFFAVLFYQRHLLRCFITSAFYFVNV